MRARAAAPAVRADTRVTPFTIRVPDEALRVTGLSSEEVGDIARSAGLTRRELRENQQRSIDWAHDVGITQMYVATLGAAGGTPALPGTARGAAKTAGGRKMWVTTSAEAPGYVRVAATRLRPRCS